MKPVEDIISRELDKDIAARLNVFSSILEEYVNIGSHILSWDIDSLKGSDENLPPILFFRNCLELIDSISISIRNSSIEPSKITVRTLIESLLYLEYIFESDTHRRCMSFLVWDTYNKIDIYKKHDINTEQGKHYQNTLNSDSVINNVSLDGLDELFNISKAVETKLSIFNKPEYKAINEEYLSIKKKKKGKKPNWYELFDGPDSIYALAHRLKLPVMYETFYRQASGYTHGTEIFQGLYSDPAPGMAEFIQIRYAKDARSITSLTLSLCLKMFRKYIENRVPDKLNEFISWYRTIRSLQLKITNAKD